MKNAYITDTSQCVVCDGRLRNAVFCSVCGESSCSWACYLRHLAQHTQHTRLAGRAATYAGEARREDRQEARASWEPSAGGRGRDIDSNANDLANCNPPE